MVVQISKSLTYIPEFNGNKDLPSSEQIVVHYKNPTYAMKEKIKGKPETKARADVNGNIEGLDISIKTNEVAIIREMLERIDGCSYEDEKGNSVGINNAKELLDSPIEFAPLVEEIVAEFEKVLEKKVPEKNSK